MRLEIIENQLIEFGIFQIEKIILFNKTFYISCICIVIDTTIIQQNIIYN